MYYFNTFAKTASRIGRLSRSHDRAFVVGQAILDGICVTDHWMAHTRMLRDLQMLASVLRRSPGLKDVCESHAQAREVVHACVAASPTRRGAGELSRFYCELSAAERRNLALSLLLLLKYETEDGIMVVLDQI